MARPPPPSWRKRCCRPAGGRAGRTVRSASATSDRQQNRNTTPEALEPAGAAGRHGGGRQRQRRDGGQPEAQPGTRNVDFDIGILTNVTSEHLEFHGSWRTTGRRRPCSSAGPDVDPQRRRPIGRLLPRSPADGWRPTGLTTRPMWASRRGCAPMALLHGHGRRLVGPGRLRAGSFNVHNALAVMALARVEGHRPRPGRSRARRGDRRAGPHGDGGPRPAVRGGGRLRAHRRLAGQGAAHPAPAGERAGDRRLRLGRERDPTKRPAMGRASAELADVTIVTDEDRAWRTRA